jgi:hypothetical protein
MIEANVEMRSAYEMQAALDHFACRPAGSVS